MAVNYKEVVLTVIKFFEIIFCSTEVLCTVGGNIQLSCGFPFFPHIPS